LTDAAVATLAEEAQAACTRRHGKADPGSLGLVISGLKLRVEIGRDLPAGTAKSTHVRRRRATPDAERPVFWRERGDVVSTPVFKCRNVLVGDEIRGPALVDCSRSTVAIRPGLLLTVDGFGSFVVTRAAVADGDE
jgi:N-methylhydantoinase A/oxoprolinase/acetone carboxylase beta subunit